MCEPRAMRSLYLHGAAQRPWFLSECSFSLSPWLASQEVVADASQTDRRCDGCDAVSRVAYCNTDSSKELCQCQANLEGSKRELQRLKEELQRKVPRRESTRRLKGI